MKKNKINYIFIFMCIGVFFAVYFMTYNMMQMQNNMGMTNDFIAHAEWATEFSFRHPLRFFRRIAYPIWHICVILFVRMFGVLLDDSTSIVTAMFTVLCMLITYYVIKKFFGKNVEDKIINICVGTLTFVTAIYMPWYNKSLYWGQGSPNIWHNPTNNAVKWIAVLIFFVFLKFIGECEMGNLKTGKCVLKWNRVFVLMLLLFTSVLLKPSFIQGFLPAVIIFLLIELFLSKGKMFYACCQIAISFIPSCILILWQMLGYWSEDGARGGVSISFFRFFGTAAPNQLISFILGWAFPLYVLIVFEKKEILTDKRVLLSVIMAIVSCCEEACIIEQGSSAGNFTWSKLLAMYILWVILLPKFITRVTIFESEEYDFNKKIKFGIGFILVSLHLVSGIYYFMYLLPGRVIL